MLLLSVSTLRISTHAPSLVITVKFWIYISLSFSGWHYLGQGGRVVSPVGTQTIKKQTKVLTLPLYENRKNNIQMLYMLIYIIPHIIIVN